VNENKINNILHLASMLSPSSEKNLEMAKLINIQGVHHALDIAKETNSLYIFFLLSDIIFFNFVKY